MLTNFKAGGFPEQQNDNDYASWEFSLTSVMDNLAQTNLAKIISLI